jgi:hypothetical protein
MRRRAANLVKWIWAAKTASFFFIEQRKERYLFQHFWIASHESPRCVIGFCVEWTLVREAADAVLFARFETELVKTNGKTRAYGEGNRIMYTESRPGWDAKNRFNLPFCMPLDWKTFGDAIRAFYGLNGKGKSATKADPKKELAPVPAQQQPEPQNGSESPLLAQVRTRLEESKIPEREFLDILKTAQISEANTATSLADFADKTLHRAIDSWDTVVGLAAEFRKCKETRA